jgi:hypothetical protein
VPEGDNIMAEHERISQNKQEEGKQKHRKKSEESRPSFYGLPAPDTSSFSLTETPFHPQMNEHVETLSQIPLAAQRHEFIMRLNNTYGQRYVQRLVEAVNAQAKLTVSTPNDIYEQEADKVTEEVTRSVNTRAQRQTPEEEELLQGKFVQRQTPEEEEESIQGKLLERQEDEEELQMQEDEEELQTKTIMQRQTPEEEEELQMQPNESTAAKTAGNIETRSIQQTGKRSLQRDRKPELTNIKFRIPSDYVSLKKVKMHLDFVKVKRNATQIAKIILAKLKLARQPDDPFGHWWTEIGDLDGTDWEPKESYGWWPATRLKMGTAWKNIKEIFKGVPGKLNAVGGNKDPDHGEKAETEFHPVMEVDEDEEYDSVRQKVTDHIRDFAKGYKGIWNWVFGFGQNCHTFQEELFKAVNLTSEKVGRWLRRPKPTVAPVEPEVTVATDPVVIKITSVKELKGIGEDIKYQFDEYFTQRGIALYHLEEITPESREQLIDYLGISPDKMDEILSSEYNEEVTLFQEKPAPISLQTKSLIQRQTPEEEEEIQAQLADNTPLHASNDIETRINSARGSGQPLADEVREPMEQAFDADFSGVRTHTDAEADTLNQELSAKAFTTGPDIFFKQGVYEPATNSGKNLLAHELTHVVQQNPESTSIKNDDLSGNSAGRVHHDEDRVVNRIKSQAVQRMYIQRLFQCPFCGYINEEDAVVCARCGKPVSRPRRAEHAEDLGPPPVPPLSPEQMEELRMADLIARKPPRIPPPPRRYGQETEPESATGLAGPLEEKYTFPEEEIPELKGPKEGPTEEKEAASEEESGEFSGYEQERPGWVPPPAEEAAEFSGYEQERPGWVPPPAEEAEVKELLSVEEKETPEEVERRKRFEEVKPYKRGKFYVKPMVRMEFAKREYIKKGKLPAGGVKYLTEEERQEYELSIRKGKQGENIFVWNDQVLDTSKFTIEWRLGGIETATPRATFVLSATGKFYIANQKEAIIRYGAKFQHSSFFAGEPVAMAGEMWFENGKLKGISDVSGHYMQDEHGDIYMIQTLMHLRDVGVNVDDVDVELYNRRTVKAGDILRFIKEQCNNDVSRFVLEKLPILPVKAPEEKEYKEGKSEEIEKNLYEELHPS